MGEECRQRPARQLVLGPLVLGLLVLGLAAWIGWKVNSARGFLMAATDPVLSEGAVKGRASAVQRIFTCGSAGSGKSTIVGSVLNLTGRTRADDPAGPVQDFRIFGTAGNDHGVPAIENWRGTDGKVVSDSGIDFQFFSKSGRSFIVSDVPGHGKLTRQLAGSASRSQFAILTVNASERLAGQAELHANICSLLGVQHVVLAVNKMDLVDYAQSAFDDIVEAFRTFSEPLGFASLVSIPMVARDGGNINSACVLMPWYKGPDLLTYLDETAVDAPLAAGPFRFPVQRAVQLESGFRGYAGSVVSGRVSVGDRIVAAVSGRPGSITRIVSGDECREQAVSGDDVTLVFDKAFEAAVGDLLVPATERPEVSDRFAAQLLWIDETHLLPGRSYELRLGEQAVPASVTTIKHRIDIHTRQQMAARNLEMSEIGVCNIATATPIAFDAYSENSETGGFILVDRTTQATVAAGMIMFGLRRATNIHVEELFVDKATRAQAKQQRATVIWFTGLSGSGKSTIAKRLEKRLYELGKHTYVLDGDNVRHGLNNDLGFTDTDRVENIRRIGEVAKLFADAGLIVMCSFISPFRAERRMVRELLESDEFIEVFVDASLEECQRRDPKGLYAKALAGKVKNFTGIDSPYEPPEFADIHLVTENVSPDDVVEKIVEYLRNRGRV